MPTKTSQAGAASADEVALPLAVLSHRTAGRFRVRVPGKRKDEPYFVRAKRVLEQHDAVDEVHIAPTTGSILVIHGGNHSVLLEHAADAGLFHCVEQHPASGNIVDWLARLDRFDREFLFARMRRQPQRAAIGLFMLAVMQVARGSVIPSAPSLLAEAMRLLREASSKSGGEDEDDA